MKQKCKEDNLKIQVEVLSRFVLNDQLKGQSVTDKILITRGLGEDLPVPRHNREEGNRIK